MMKVTKQWMTLVVIAVAIVGLARLVKSQAPPISKAYIFSQAICLPPPTPAPGQPSVVAPTPTPGVCAPQTVALQSIVQVQLPGTPSRWKVVAADGLALKQAKVIPDQLRIAGTSEIYIFNFSPTRRG